MKPAYIVWAVAFGLTLIVVYTVLSTERALYYGQDNISPNHALTYGEVACVSDVRLGWCDNFGKVIEVNNLTDSLLLTVYVQNFDGWLLREARNEPRLLPRQITPQELSTYESLKKEHNEKKLDQQRETAYDQINAKIQQWIVQERGNLRLMFAGRIIETIPPFDATAPPTYGEGEFRAETYNRLVFHLVAPTEAAERDKWRSILRAVGMDCDVQISLGRPVEGLQSPMRLQTLVNSDQITDLQATPVKRRVPLVPPKRRGLAWIAVIFTLATVFATAVGTELLRDSRNVADSGKPNSPWSLSRIVFAWWVAICVACFAYLWAILGAYQGVLSKTAFLLMGLQGGTMILSTKINSKQQSVQASTAPVSAGFLTDLLSENGQADISRLQMLIWNVVLGLVFIWQSVFGWEMPEFDSTIMMLLGISSTAYLGFKYVPK